jgi:hypothetical protein
MDVLLKLSREWILGEQIDKGGFGRVFAAQFLDGKPAVVKMVPKAPGADRELLFVKLDGVRNVVPIIDKGEANGNWAIVMPRAEKSLRQHLDESNTPLNVEGRCINLDRCRYGFGRSGRQGRASRPEAREYPAARRAMVPRRFRHFQVCRSLDSSGYSKVRPIAALRSARALAARTSSDGNRRLFARRDRVRVTHARPTSWVRK